LQKLRLGMHLEIREGSFAKNMSTLLRPIINMRFPIRNCFFVSDDITVSDILQKGHMDYLVRRGIDEGLDPLDAIRLVTINTAEHFNVDRDVGGIAPGRYADILIVEDLTKVTIKTVIASGIIVFHDDKLIWESQPIKTPKFMLNTIKLKEKVKPEDFIIKIPLVQGVLKEVKVKVIDLNWPQIITKQIIRKMKVQNQVVINEYDDIAKVSVVERHKGTGNISKGFVKGFDIKKGAVASSVSHDVHNIVVVGRDDVSMATAVNRISELGGGVVVTLENEVLAELPLPIAGLMCDKPAGIVSRNFNNVNNKLKELGVLIDDPIPYLSFITLPVIPEIRITDKGLVDVFKGRLTPLFEE